MGIQLSFTEPALLFAQATPQRDWGVMEFLFFNPWLIVVCMALFIPIVAIVVGTITEYMKRTRLAEIDAQLKREMLERGMSAEEIRAVLEASSAVKKKSRRCEPS
jgi:hypothetical protein